MERVLILKDGGLVEVGKNRGIVLEVDDVERVVAAAEMVERENSLFCVKLHVKQEITEIAFREEWQRIPLVVYPAGLGAVRDLIGLLPLLKKLNVKFFFDSALGHSYEAVQILSSLGIYSGIWINERADWEKLTDLMYYALCGKVVHAPIEPFQYLYDVYERNRLVDYGGVFFEDGEVFEVLTAKNEGMFKVFDTEHTEEAQRSTEKNWQRFFYEATPCAACPGWRICMGKYANMKDKTPCQSFTTELLNLIETIKLRNLRIKN